MMRTVLWAALVGLTAIGVVGTDVAAQVRPDATLGAESSRVRQARFRGRDGVTRDNDVIEGGAQRGGNLFHSFEQFDVPEGRGAYFGNPADVRNIFSRVTSADRSEIFGTLGVLGDANLFFMNPNGVLFGPNASLDVGGSFAATTANAMQFGEQGFFSATNPEVPSQLLTVNPSAFLFNQIVAQPITVNSRRLLGSSDDGSPVFEGLNVPDGKSFVLLGGNVILDAGKVETIIGSIDIGGLSGAGTVNLDISNDQIGLTFPSNASLANVSLTNGSQVYNSVLTTGNARDIRITANSLQVSGGSTVANRTIGQGNAGNIIINARDAVMFNNATAIARLEAGGVGQGGDIRITAGSLSVSNGAQISASSLSQGNAGNVIIDARDAVSLSNGTVFSRLGDSAIGQGGAVRITAGSLLINQGARISTSSFNRGNSGNIIVNARGSVSLNNGSLESGAGNSASDIGSAGNIEIRANAIYLRDNSGLSATVGGQGNAGDIILNAGNAIDLSGTGNPEDRAGFFNTAKTGSRGISGNIIITADSLSISNAFLLQAGIFGQEVDAANVDTGNIIIQTNGAVKLNSATLSTMVGPNAIAPQQGGGDIRINAASLTARNDTQLSTQTDGRGNAGDISITASDYVYFEGRVTNRDQSFSSYATTRVAKNAVGNGGDIIIRTPSLFLTNGASLDASTFGNGAGGNIAIYAPNSVTITGVGRRPNGRYFNLRPSGVYTNSGEEAGAGGDITIATDSLLLAYGAVIFASTSSPKPAGDISITTNTFKARDGGQVIGASRAPNTLTTAPDGSLTFPETGSSSNITIRASESAVFSGNSPFYLGQRNQGSVERDVVVSINGRDIIVPANAFLVNEENAEGKAVSGVFTGTSPISTGDGGRIEIRTPQLNIVDGAQISARTLGYGNAGDIALDVSNLNLQNGGQIVALSNIQNAGNPNNLTDTRGEPGNITIRNADRVSLSDNSSISTSVGSGVVLESSTVQSSNIRIQARQLSLDNNSEIIASTSGQGDAGNIAIQDAEKVALSNNSTISTAVNSGAVGTGGDIQIDSDALTLTNSQISAATSSTGNPGSISVRDADTVSLNNSTISSAINPGGIATQRGNIDIQTRALNLNNGSNVTASATNRGDAGNITVRDADTINLNGGSSITSAVNSGAIGNGGSITLDTNALELNRANVTASTQGQGRAGNITVQNADRVSLNRGDISTTVGETGVGQGGDIEIQTGRLNLQNRSNISSSTAGTGNTGRIAVNATENINLRNSRITNRVETGATGNSRTIRLDTPQLNLTDSRISAATNGNGSAGSVIVSDANSIRLNDSTLSTRIEANGTARARSPRGNIRLETRNLDLTNGSRITANTANRGDAGNIRVQNAEQITASDNSRISSTVQRRARGQGGNIILDTAALNLDNAQITASSSGRGNAGNIQVQNADRISVDQGSISTEVNSPNGGRGGSITLETGTLSLESAQVNANTVSRRPAGSINLNATGNLTATDSQIATSSQRSSGGDINLAANQVRLDNSDIRTDLRQGSATGGNINANADVVIARDDSDIISAAPEGQGGDITLPLFFGENYQPALSEQANPESLDGNGRVDINATGQISSGVIQTPDTSQIQNALADLPNSAIDTENLLANSCIARPKTGGIFLITGTGGLRADRPGSLPTLALPHRHRSQPPLTQAGTPATQLSNRKASTDCPTANWR